MSLKGNTTKCGDTTTTYDGGVLFCDKPKGHKGWHEESVKLRDRVERTSWGSDGLGIHASKDRLAH